MVRGRAGPAGPAAAGWVERAPPGITANLQLQISHHCSAVQSKGKVATDWRGEIRSLRHYGYQHTPPAAAKNRQCKSDCCQLRTNGLLT